MKLSYQDFNYQATEKNTVVITKDIKLDNLIIEKGFESDGASIPRLFWFIYPPFKPKYLPACIVHDFECKQAGNDYKKHIKADKNFRKNLRYLKISSFTAFIFFYGTALKSFIKYKLLKRIFENGKLDV